MMKVPQTKMSFLSLNDSESQIDSLSQITNTADFNRSDRSNRSFSELKTSGRTAGGESFKIKCKISEGVGISSDLNLLL